MYCVHGYIPISNDAPMKDKLCNFILLFPSSKFSYSTAARTEGQMKGSLRHDMT